MRENCPGNWGCAARRVYDVSTKWHKNCMRTGFTMSLLSGKFLKSLCCRSCGFISDCHRNWVISPLTQMENICKSSSFEFRCGGRRRVESQRVPWGNNCHPCAWFIRVNASVDYVTQHIDAACDYEWKCDVTVRGGKQRFSPLASSDKDCGKRFFIVLAPQRLLWLTFNFKAGSLSIHNMLAMDATADVDENSIFQLTLWTTTEISELLNYSSSVVMKLPCEVLHAGNLHKTSLKHYALIIM